MWYLPATECFFGPKIARPAIYNNQDEPGRHYGKWNKSQEDKHYMSSFVSELSFNSNKMYSFFLIASGLALEELCGIIWPSFLAAAMTFKTFNINFLKIHFIAFREEGTRRERNIYLYI